MRELWAWARHGAFAAGTLAAALIVASPNAAAQAPPPSLEVGEAQAISPGDAWTYFNGVGLSSPTRDPDPLVERTASALGDDALRIYAFVHDEMDVVPLFGVQKGARGCLIDKACTPFDQVHLLVELLRAAGYAPVYRFGEVTLTQAQMSDWLGVDSGSALDEILADGGIPFTTSGSGESATYTLLHLWAEVTIDSVLYRMDPGFKSYTERSGALDQSALDAAMGFSASSFMSSSLSGASSSTSGAPQVAGFNRDNVRSQLQDYSENLLDEIRETYADADLSDVIGGRDIDRHSGALPTSPGYTIGTVRTTFDNDIPYALRTQTTFSVTGGDTFNWRLDEFYGEELAFIPMQIFPQQGSPDPIQFRFYRNGQPITPWRNGAGAGVAIAFNHPYAADDGAYLDRALGGGGVFHAGAIQIVVGGGRMTPDFGAYLEARSSAEEGYVSIQPTGGDEPPGPIVTGAQRATKRRYAASFATQFSAAVDMAGQIGEATIVVHDLVVTAHTIPMLGGTAITPQSTIGALSVEGAISANSNAGDAAQTQAARRAAGALLGALEGSAVEQNLDSVHTISTATRFDWFSASSEHSSGERRFYWANASNWTYVSAQIQADGYYGEAASRTLAQSYVDAGYTVIVPRSSYLGPGVDQIVTCSILPIPAPECLFPGPERGAAIIAISAAGVAHVVTAQAVLLKGGGGTDDAESNPTRIFSIPEDFLERQFTSRAEAYNVDLGTGAVSYTPAPDLVAGEGGYPYSLSFQRSYRSGSGYQRDYPDGPPAIGPWQERFSDSGWTSNWMAEARMQNDGQRAFGDQSPREATDTIVAIRVLLALSTDQGSDLATLQYQLGAIHAMAWWSEQLTYNSVQIVHGADNRSFFRLADGTFQGQPGDGTVLELFGERYVPVDVGTYTAPRWYYNRMCVRTANRDGSASYYGTWNEGFSACDTSADPTPLRGVQWMRFARQSFREGVVVSFDGETLSNSLGRSITVSTVSAQPPVLEYQVRDDAAPSTRVVTIALDQSSGPGTMSVTGTDGETWVWDGSSDASWRIFAPSSDEDPIVTFGYVWDACPAPPALCPADIRVRGQVAELIAAVANDNEYATAQYFISTGRIGAMVDPEGHATRTYFDQYAQPVRVTNRLGYDTVTDYDVFRRVARVTYPEGNAEEYAYDARHNRILTRRIGKPSSGLSPTEVSATYDALCNMALTQTDALGNVTTYALVTDRCLISSVTQPAVDDGTTSSSALVNPVTTYTWNAYGQLLTRVDPTGREVRNGYDNDNYLETVTVENGSSDIVTTFGRNAVGDITSVTDPRGNVHTGTYDASRRLTRYDGPSGTNVATEWRYNGDGQVDRIRQATGLSSPDDWSTTTYAYWPAGRPHTMTDPDGGVTTYIFDDLNRPFAVIDPVGRRSETVYDAEGQVLEEHRAVGTALAQIYALRAWTPNGQLDWVQDANDNRSNLDYDGFDRLHRLYFPVPTLGAETASTTDYEEYSYDENDNRVSLRLRSSETIEYAYDALNREILKDIPGGTDADVHSRYDLAGRRTLARFSSTVTPSSDCTASNAGIDYCYDAVGRLLYETSYGRRLVFEYDQTSNRTRITHPDSTYIQYTYDALNRVDQLQLNGSASGASLIADYAYDAMSRRTSLTRGNGVATGYEYTQASRLSELSHDMAGTAHDATWTFGYTDAGQLSSRSLVDVYEWPVNALDEDYEANGLNQYTTVDSAAFNYDARGNLISDGSRNFAYDLENRLISASGSVEGQLAYDPLGRLRSFEADDVTTEFLYDGDRLVAEYVSGNVARRYAHGPGVDEPLVWFEGDDVSDPRWLVADRQGSIIAATDDTGAAIQTYAYGPYGEPDSWAGARFRYTGQAVLPELQLYHYKARVYDPLLGRFLQTDPIGYQDDLNLYAYVRSDPLNLSDPTGRRPPDDDMIAAHQTGGYVPPYADTYERNRERVRQPEPTNTEGTTASPTGSQALQVASTVRGGQTLATGAGMLAAGSDVALVAKATRGMGLAGVGIGATAEGLRANEDIRAGMSPGRAWGGAFGRLTTTAAAAGAGALAGTAVGSGAGPPGALIGGLVGGLVGAIGSDVSGLTEGGGRVGEQVPGVVSDRLQRAYESWFPPF